MAKHLQHKQVTCGSCGAERTIVSGTSLRQLRQTAGLSLREVARRLGLTASYLCDIELDRRNATDAIIAAYKTLS